MTTSPSTKLIRSFFQRTLLMTVILVLLLSFLVPLVMYFTSLSRYEQESEVLLKNFIRSTITMDPQNILTDSRARASVEEDVSRFIEFGSLVEFKIWDRDSTVVYAYREKQQTGKSFLTDELLRKALVTGQASVEVADATSSENSGLRRYGRLVEMYVPIVIDGRVVGAAEVYRIAPEFDYLGNHIVFVVATTFAIMVLMYITLYGQFKQAAVQLATSETRTRRAYESLGYSYFATIRSLIKALEIRDMETEGHSERVVAISLHIGRKLALTRTELAKLVLGSYLHDIGKIGIADAILLKPALLTGDERITMQTHVRKGIEIIRDIPFLRLATEIVRYHHERWDGKGYPFRLKGDEIPVTARIFAVADVFDALVNDRPYRAALPFEKAKDIILQERGSHFEPTVVDALMQIDEEEYRELYREISVRGVHHSVSTALEHLLGLHDEHFSDEHHPEVAVASVDATPLRQFAVEPVNAD